MIRLKGEHVRERLRYFGDEAREAGLTWIGHFPRRDSERMDGSTVRSERDNRKSRRRAQRFLNVATEDVKVVGVRGARGDAER